MDRLVSRRALACLATGLWLVASSSVVGADSDLEQRLLQVESSMSSMQTQLEARDARIAALESELTRLRGASGAADSGVGSQSQGDMSLLDRMVSELTPSAGPAGAAGSRSGAAGSNQEPIMRLGPARLMDISAVLDTTVGTSTAGAEDIGNLQGGGHDPSGRGFSLQGVELSLGGAVDPYFTGEAHMVFGDGFVELEEAFATTTSLPWGLELEAGYFLTEFGRINPSHLHSWQWIDQPFINTRLFGADGMRGAGLRLGWLTPLPWYSELHVGVQNASGETMASFMGEGEAHDHGGDAHGDGEEEAASTVGGRPIVDRDVASLDDMVYLVRWVNGWDLNDEWSMQLGASGLFGPNNTGGDGHTQAFGADLVMKWRAPDQRRGWPYLTWQTEIMQRNFRASAFSGTNDADEPYELPEETLMDWGIYSQLLWGFRENWAVGLRGEYASGSGDSYDEDVAVPRQEDASRADRVRVSPLLMWQPSEYSRVRLQYNYDRADFLPDDSAHSVWLGLEILLGSHPSHGY